MTSQDQQISSAKTYVAEAVYIGDDIRTLGQLDNQYGNNSGELRVAPFLAVVNSEVGAHVYLGTAEVLVKNAAVEMRLRIAYQANVEDSKTLSFIPSLNREDLLTPELESYLDRAVARYLPVADASDKDDAQVATTIAKALAEKSVDSLHDVRGVRYKIEQQLVEKGSTSVSSETVVSSLTHLGILLGKALDNTRQLLREGLWLHHNDRDPYHSYRRHRDQTLLKVAEALPQSKWPWMPTYDAAVRQCESLEFQLREESRSVRSLLAAASSISSAKEADAQSQLNFIVATASIAIGVPALVFSLFGSNNFEPLKEFAATHWAWIYGSGLVATVITGFLLALRRTSRVRRLWIPMAYFAAVICLVQTSLLLGPPQPPQPLPSETSAPSSTSSAVSK
jgi:Mg2+ and Co2+ transporter CorA